jgi:hypothetical protein
LYTSKPSISSYYKIARGVLHWIYIRLSSIVVGILYISFLTAIPLIVISLPIPIAGRLTVGVSVGGKGAALGTGAEVGAEDDIAVASIRFKLAIELNIYLELIEKVCILLRI